ncbi:unnamed protein product, partial [Candidula unifasciata]
TCRSHSLSCIFVWSVLYVYVRHSQMSRFYLDKRTLFNPGNSAPIPTYFPKVTGLP